MEHVAHGALAARGFGKFDDVAVGVEVFARDELLESLESAPIEAGE